MVFSVGNTLIYATFTDQTQSVNCENVPLLTQNRDSTTAVRPTGRLHGGLRCTSTPRGGARALTVLRSSAHKIFLAQPCAQPLQILVSGIWCDINLLESLLDFPHVSKGIRFSLRIEHITHKYMYLSVLLYLVAMNSESAYPEKR